jgi:hypothetical protein
VCVYSVADSCLCIYEDNSVGIIVLFLSDDDDDEEEEEEEEDDNVLDFCSSSLHTHLFFSFPTHIVYVYVCTYI